MVEIVLENEAPAEFLSAIESLRSAVQRRELGLIQIPAPRNLASFAVAFAASAETKLADGEVELSSGRFILLYESKPQTEWNGKFRVVAFAKSAMELDIADDHLVADVAWGWLTSSLKQRLAAYAEPAGTATRVISSGYGGLQDQSNHAELELRASWTPSDDDFSKHLEAWQDLVCLMAGHLETHTNVTQLSIQNT